MKHPPAFQVSCRYLYSMLAPLDPDRATRRELRAMCDRKEGRSLYIYVPATRRDLLAEILCASEYDAPYDILADFMAARVRIFLALHGARR